MKLSTVWDWFIGSMGFAQEARWATRKNREKEGARASAGFWIAILSLVVALASAIFTGLQYRIGRETMRQQLRAYVFVDMNENISMRKYGTDAWKFEITLKNYGSTPAHDYYQEVGADISGLSFNGPYQRGEPVIRQYSIIAPGAHIRSSITIHYSGIASSDPNEYIHLYGKFYYIDVFKRPHTGFYCLESNIPFGALVSKATPVDPTDFNQCRDGGILN